MQEPSEQDPLIARLAPPARRLQRRRLLQQALRTLGPAAALSVLILAAGRLWPLPQWRLWASLPLALWALLHLLRAPFLRPTAMVTARQLDRELGLRERLATAVELAGRGRDTPLARAQRSDALERAGRIDPARDLPWHLPWSAWTRAGALIAVALVLLLLPNPQEALLQQRAAVRQAAQEQAAELEAIAEEIAALESLSPQERQDLLQALEGAAENLRRNRGDPGEALADLAQARQALRQTQAAMEERQETVDAVEQALRQLAGELAQGSETALAAAQAGLEALPELLEAMDEAQIGELAAQAAELARRAAADAELARSLQALSQALQEQDPQALARAAEALAAALEQAGAQIAAQAQAEAAVQAALESLEGGQGALAEAAGGGTGGEGMGEGTAGEGGAGQEGSAGTGAETGEGEGPSEGMGTGEGSSGEGGGWFQDPNRPQEDQVDWSGEEVYVPLGPDGRPAVISGDPTAGGETVDLPGLAPEPGEEGTAVPYEAILRAYGEAAARAMERSYIPPGMREYVREYFSRLER